MAFLLNLPVILGLFAVFSASFAVENCTTILFGQQTLSQRPLTRAYFSPGAKIEEIHIHSGCEALGMLVTACDDLSPNVYVKSITEALIDRQGSLSFLGYVDVVAFCPYNLSIVSPKSQSKEPVNGSNESKTVV